MRRTAKLAILMLATVLIWLASPQLAWPARAAVVVLLSALPWLTLEQRHFAHEIPETLKRREVYATTAVAVWVLALTCVFAAFAGGFTSTTLGLRTLPIPQLLGWSIASTVLGLGVMAVGRLLDVRETTLLRFLLPRTTAERAGFIALSLSAGVAEELVFRAFLVSALILVTGSAWLSVSVASLAFGVLHAYQGSAGIVRTAVLGAVLAIPFLLTGSIVPSMIAHAAINIAAGLWLARWLLRS